MEIEILMIDGQCKCPAGWGGVDCLIPRTHLHLFYLYGMSHVISTKNATLWRMATSNDYEKKESLANARTGGMESIAMASLDPSNCECDANL
jgi:hypothetical protein